MEGRNEKRSDHRGGETVIPHNVKTPSTLNRLAPLFCLLTVTISSGCHHRAAPLDPQSRRRRRHHREARLVLARQHDLARPGLPLQSLDFLFGLGLFLGLAAQEAVRGPVDADADLAAEPLHGTAAGLDPR